MEEPFWPSHADCRVLSARSVPLNHSRSHTLPQHGSGMPEASAALLLALRFAPRPLGCAARALIANALAAEPVLAGITRHEIQATRPRNDSLSVPAGRSAAVLLLPASLLRSWRLVRTPRRPRGRTQLLAPDPAGSSLPPR